MSKRRLPLLLLFSLTCLTTVQMNLFAAGSEDQARERLFEAQERELDELVGIGYDYAIVLNVHVLKNFLEYKGSKLFPVAAIDAIYAPRSNNKDRNFDDLKLYETFWFHKSNGLGVSREMRLSLREGSHGMIVVDDTPDSVQQTQPLCNAIVRTLLDVHLQKSDFTVMVPDNIFSQIAADLSIFRFQEKHSIGSAEQGILMHVTSHSRKQDKYFWFSR